MLVKLTNMCIIFIFFLLRIEVLSNLIMEKLVQELMEYLNNASNEQLEEDFKELEYYNEIGPNVEDFIKNNEAIA